MPSNAIIKYKNDFILQLWEVQVPGGKVETFVKLADEVSF